MGDYCKFPIGVPGVSVSQFKLRAVVKIWNDWMRNQNLQSAAAISLNDTTVAGTNGVDPITDAIKGGALLPANKLKDYFTTCLPAPQKGAPVKLPLGLTAPVITGADRGALPSGTDSLIFLPTDGSTPSTSARLLGLDTAHGARTGALPAGSTVSIPVAPSNLYADLANASSSTINDLRHSFAIQRLYEIDGIGGTRYTEMIQAVYGVVNPDGRLQRSEFLGGKRSSLASMQVPQTSQSTTGATASPQGNLASFMYGNDVDQPFHKSFTEYGVIVSLLVLRPVHTYQYGIDRMDLRKSRFDFHHPVFNHLGEQPVSMAEIFATSDATANAAVFGYQEVFADMRLRLNSVTGKMRSNSAETYDFVHYADKFAAAPTLTDSFIRETTGNVNRTFGVDTTTDDIDFLINVHFDVDAVRPLPTFGTPSAIGRY